MEKKPSTIRKLGKRIVMTSSTLLDSFLSDTADKKNQKEKLQETRFQLRQAAANKQLVVLQIQGEKIGSFETVAGWIVGKSIGHEQVVLKLQNNHQQMRMVPLHTILKVSTLTTKSRLKDKE